MIAIIAEKPSVGRDIARVIGATEKKDGYMAGNGYLVTWALGHLVSLAMPSTYGYGKASYEDLPMLPDPFRLVIRQIKTDRGMVTDIGATKQLKVIDDVFSKCNSIIVAMDAGREGELIFRYIYHYLGYTKPFKRLWISSLTDEAIRAGMSNLNDGEEYDSLYHAADCRAKADWLVGMNASRALAVASGMPNSSLGRVQTPTLAMICSRYMENRDFVSTPYWQLHITLERMGEFRQFSHLEDFKTKEQAETAHARFSPDSTALITKVERKHTYQQAPLLYDLTTLQKDCSTHHDMTADKTLAVAQALYEKKYISYPRTGSRYIPHDLMEQVYDSLWKIATMPEFKEYGKRFDFGHLNMRSVDDDKITDHHALIITGVKPEELNTHEQIVYTMIAGRMLEAFSPRCEKESLVMEATAEDMKFRSRSTAIVNPGWRAVFARKKDAEKDETEANKGTARFAEGEQIPITGYGMARRKTMPKPLYTEATLLAAMETCGRNITDEKANGLKDEAQNHIIPLTLTGTPEEMDAGFLQAVMQPVRKAAGLISNMVEFEKQADKAAANSKAAKDAKSKETKEEKEKREKYEKHFKKAEELVAAKNHKDAIADLQQARLYAKADDQKKVDEMIAAQKKAMNQGSLFEMMEEASAPAPQVTQPQNVILQPAQRPASQPVQQTIQPQHSAMRPVQQPMQRPVQQPARSQYAEQPQYVQQPQGGYSQMPPRQPQAGQQGHMFPAQEQPPLPPKDYGHYSAMLSDEPAYRPEDYEDYPDFPQSMLENHYSQSYNQTV